MNTTGPAVEETVVRLEHEGNTLYTWRCTPTDLHALVLGRLYSDNLIDNAEFGSALEITPGDGEIVITLKHGLGAARQRKPRTTPVTIPGADEFAELYRGLFARLDERYGSGGMHAAALAWERTLMYQADDVGRHNAADKVLGMALLDGADITRHGMLLTSRISGEIARKAATANVEWLASRSIPTTLALRVAQEAELPIVGRAAGKNSYLYR